MPATLEDYRLAQSHRLDQAAIQRGYTGEAATLWALWATSSGDTGRRQLWLRQNVQLIRSWRNRSAIRGQQFAREAYRLDKGRDLPQRAIEHDPDSVLVRDLLNRSAGVYRKARIRGLDELVAQERAQAATLASGGRLVQAGGRDAIEQSSKPLGWMRVSDGDPCSFCALILSRGAVFKSQLTAGADANERFAGDGMFKFHDNCGCTVLPIHSRTDFMSDDAQRFRNLWDETTAGLSGADARNAFRRALDAQRRAAAA